MEKRAAEGAHTLKLRWGERAWSMVVELFATPKNVGSSLGVKETHHLFHFDCLGWKSAAGAFTSGVFDIPTGGDQTKESSLVPEAGLDRKVGQIMEREMSGVPSLVLPGDGAILTRAAKHSRAVRAFDDFNLQDGSASCCCGESLVYFFFPLQHCDEMCNLARARLRFLRGLYSPKKRVSICFVQSLEKRLGVLAVV